MIIIFHHDSLRHNFMQCVSGGVVLIPGLCCLKFLFVCNTQACLTVSSIHPALQMLQLPMNIKRKGLEILTPALPAPPPLPSLPPTTVCLPSVYLLPCMWSDTPNLLPLYHIFIYYSYDERLVRTWTYFTRVVAVDNKVHFSKNLSINSKQAASLSSNMRTTSHHS